MKKEEVKRLELLFLGVHLFSFWLTPASRRLYTPWRGNVEPMVSILSVMRAPEITP